MNMQFHQVVRIQGTPVPAQAPHDGKMANTGYRCGSSRFHIDGLARSTGAIGPCPIKRGALS